MLRETWTLSLSSSRVPCSSASAVSVGLSSGRVLSGSVSCVRCGGALVVGVWGTV